MQLSAMLLYFNSQPHEEADDGGIADALYPKISTHSLTRRLTLRSMRSVFMVDHFNSQPHEEADSILQKKLFLQINFNSQPHEEADSNFKQKSFYLKLFFIFIA